MKHRSRVMLEVRKRLRKNYATCNILYKKSNDNNIQDIPDSTLPGCSSSNNISILSDNCDIAQDTNIINDESSFSMSSSSSKISDTFSAFSDNFYQPTFRERLASCFVDNNLTHVQGNSILALLRTHSCFSNLPKDVRTLLCTPRNGVVISNVEPGQYIHFDLETGIVESLSNTATIPTELELDFHTDGCSLDKAGTVHLWPIQCRVCNMEQTKPIIVGIYKGSQKSYDPNSFFKAFINDVRTIMSNGGITFNGNKVPIKLRSFIADAPARAFILNHRGHMSSRPCSKCKISGTLYEGRNVFIGINHPLRTDEEYIRGLDEDHHKEGISPLSMLPIRMSSQVPFEYMHLVCLGVMKKLLTAWVYGKYSKTSKLSGRLISVICERLHVLRQYCPSDFARHPRSLDICSKYKATEFRQFLLYTGPVVIYGLLGEHLYKHFLLLHSAIRVLISKSPSKQHLTFAELALQKFVFRADNLYGRTFNSYNVHGLLHLTDDVRRFGNLDSYSAFPYENNMSIFRKYCRKPSLPLQQFFNRMREIQIHGTNNNRKVDASIRVFMPYNNGSNFPQYRKIQFNKILLSIDLRDNCCILHNGSVCIVFDIIVRNSSYLLQVRKFLEVENFYDIGIPSSSVEVYKCGNLCSNLVYVNVEEVKAKCYRMPFWSNILKNESESDKENCSEGTTYIIATIIHSEII